MAPPHSDKKSSHRSYTAFCQYRSSCGKTSSEDDNDIRYYVDKNGLISTENPSRIMCLDNKLEDSNAGNRINPEANSPSTLNLETPSYSGSQNRQVQHPHGSIATERARRMDYLRKEMANKISEIAQLSVQLGTINSEIDELEIKMATDVEDLEKIANILKERSANIITAIDRIRNILEKIRLGNSSTRALTYVIMNTLFNTALKQSTSLRHDLSSQSPSLPLTPATLGQISASLTSFSRTLDSYAGLAKQELNPAKQEKAQERLKSFREDLASYRTHFAELKASSEEIQTSQNRTELLGRRPHHAATPENPYANTTSSAGPSSASPWAPRNGTSGGGQLSMQSGDYERETHALREQSFFANTHSALDDYLARGGAVLSDLSQQREMLKGTQRKMYNVANTLGISHDTIRMIERRARQDKWIFWAGVVIFFTFCYLVLKWLR
ncbi:hypothetical protein B7463_g6027, partial [Scytalidium lignicola]